MKIDDKNTHQLFNKLLEAYEEGEEDQYEELLQQLNDAGLEFAFDTIDTLSWMESEIEGFSEFPVVTQKVTLSLGGVAVKEWELEYGCEFVDYTHTGTQGQWAPLRIDEQENYALEEMLEGLDIEIPTPDVPPPKAV